MRSAVGGQAPPLSIEHEGRTYRLNMLNFVMLTELGDWMLQRECDARVASDKSLLKAGLLTVEQIIARKDTFVEDAVVTGRYSLGSPRMLKMFGTLEKAAKETVKEDDAEANKAALGELFEPIMKLFSLMIGCDFDTVINLHHACGAELMDKMNLVLKQSLPDPKEAAVPDMAQATAA